MPTESASVAVARQILIEAGRALTRSEIADRGGPYDYISNRAGIAIPSKPKKWIAEELIDPGARALVRLLCQCDFATSGSCEGGDGHPFEFLTIQIDPNGKRTMYELAMDLINWSQDIGLTGFTVSVHFAYQHQRPMKDAWYIQLEVWSDEDRDLFRNIR